MPEGRPDPRPGETDTIAGLVRALRERRLLTQEELADRSGLSAGTIRGLEAGRIARPRRSSVRMLAAALDLDDSEREALALSAGQDPSAVVPPSGPVLPVPAQLPPDVAGFTGREDQLARLDELVLRRGTTDRSGPVLISTIAGAAGVGKTALAVHWAHRVAERFPDGQLYVNLSGHQASAPLAPIDALAALLHSLGAPTDQVPSDLQAATAAYRSQVAGRRMLVVLDDAGSSDQVRPLLPGAPGSLVVVTSRSRLSGLIARDGATRVQVDVLSADQALTLLTRILGAERIDAEPDAAAALAAACGYLPLALRVAAAHLVDRPHRSIADYLAVLTEQPRLNGLQIADDAATSVRAAFDVSYRGIDPRAQRLFRLLGLVPGPDLTLDDAAALAALPREEAASLLDILVGAHLIAERATGRYALHDLLRIYAEERCAATDPAAERDGAIHRLLGRYLQSADAAATLLYRHVHRLPVPRTGHRPPIVSFTGSVDARAWLETERANLLAAITYAIREGPRSLAWPLAACLRGSIWRPDRDEWHETLQAVLAAARKEGDHYGEAVILHGLAEMYAWLDRTDEAMRSFQQSAQLFIEQGDRLCEAVCLCGLGRLHRVRGRYPAAIRCLEAAIAVFVELDQRADEAEAAHELGILLMEQGQFAEARTHLERALDLLRRDGIVDTQHRPLRGLGLLHLRQGRLDEAERCFSEARAVSHSINDRFSQALGTMLLARVAVARGSPRLALTALDGCLETFHRVGDRFNEAFVLHAMGQAHLDQGDVTAAKAALDDALATWTQLDMPLWRARVLVTVGDLLAAGSRPDDARRTWREALSAFESLGAPDAAEVRTRLAQA